MSEGFKRQSEIDPTPRITGPKQPRLSNRRVQELAERWKPEGIAPIGGAELVSLLQEVQGRRWHEFNQRERGNYQPRPAILF